MIDIIEHIDKNDALKMLEHFLKKGSNLIIATPIEFFQQELYQSQFENHVSHWTKGDFTKLGYVDYQYYDAGAVYLLSFEKLDIRGFGCSMIKKARRIARALQNELH